MHIWPSKRVMKSSKLWGKMDKDYKYDMLGLSEKERLEIDKAKAKRMKRTNSEEEGEE